MNEDKPLISVSQLIGLIGTLIGVWGILDQKGMALAHSLSIVLLLFICVGVIWMNLNYRHLRYRRYKIIHTERGREGIEVLDMLKKARKNVTVMHSYPSVPSQEYTDTLLHIIKHKRVPLVRLMPEYVYDFPAVVTWLTQFNDLEPDLYRPHVIHGKHSLVPFHFILIDDCQGLLYFPDKGRARDATEVVIFRDEQFAALIRNVVIRLITESPRPRKKRTNQP